VVVTPQDDKAYTIVAEPIDRTGFALGTLAPREGMKGEMPQQRPRALLTMGDMGMEGMEDMVMTPEDMISGWKKPERLQARNAGLCRSSLCGHPKRYAPAGAHH
jgi:FtsP/CotA-like multicopper oxidase with cupredoxin domain